MQHLVGKFYGQGYDQGAGPEAVIRITREESLRVGNALGGEEVVVIKKADYEKLLGVDKNDPIYITS